jgi:hypothetical protein
MYKAFLFGTALTVSVTAMVLMAPNSAREAFAYDIAEDSVFMDDGDSGDFGSTPQPAPATPAKKTSKTSKKDSARKPSSEETAPAADDLATPGSLDDLEAAAGLPAETPVAAPTAPVEATNEAPIQMAAPEEAPMMAPAAAPEEAPAATPKKEAKKAKVAKASKKSSGAKGKFANTKTECPLLREPASESETMVTVKAPRKIWVEEVDASWVRAFNKAGEPGYVSTECFE